MTWADCWSSAPCLESLERGYRFWGAWIAVIGAVALLASGVIGKRISSVKSPRQITAEQTQLLVDRLKDAAGAKFRIGAYGPNEESQSYGRQLLLLLQHADWVSQGTVVCHMDGESPPVGITVRVSGVDPDALQRARKLVESFKAANIEDVDYEVDPRLCNSISSSWIVIQVGVKPGV